MNNGAIKIHVPEVINWKTQEASVEIENCALQEEAMISVLQWSSDYYFFLAKNTFEVSLICDK